MATSSASCLPDSFRAMPGRGSSLSADPSQFGLARPGTVRSSSTPEVEGATDEPHVRAVSCRFATSLHAEAGAVAGLHHTLVLGQAVQADLQCHFRVTPPVHQMLLTLERSRLIRRQQSVAGSIQVLVQPDVLPRLLPSRDQPVKPPCSGTSARRA